MEAISQDIYQPFKLYLDNCSVTTITTLANHTRFWGQGEGDKEGRRGKGGGRKRLRCRTVNSGKCHGASTEIKVHTYITTRIVG